MNITVRLVKRVRSATLKVMNENGLVIFSEEKRFPAERNGDVMFFCNVCDNDGRPMPAGVYFIWVDADQDIKPAKAAVIR